MAINLAEARMVSPQHVSDTILELLLRRIREEILDVYGETIFLAQLVHEYFYRQQGQRRFIVQANTGRIAQVEERGDQENYAALSSDDYLLDGRVLQKLNGAWKAIVRVTSSNAYHVDTYKAVATQLLKMDLAFGGYADESIDGYSVKSLSCSEFHMRRNTELLSLAGGVIA